MEDKEIFIFSINKNKTFAKKFNSNTTLIRARENLFSSLGKDFQFCYEDNTEIFRHDEDDFYLEDICIKHSQSKIINIKQFDSKTESFNYQNKKTEDLNHNINEAPVPNIPQFTKSKRDRESKDYSNIDLNKCNFEDLIVICNELMIPYPIKKNKEEIISIIKQHQLKQTEAPSNHILQSDDNDLIDVLPIIYNDTPKDDMIDYKTVKSESKIENIESKTAKPVNKTEYVESKTAKPVNKTEYVESQFENYLNKNIESNTVKPVSHTINIDNKTEYNENKSKNIVNKSKYIESNTENSISKKANIKGDTENTVSNTINIDNKTEYNGNQTKNIVNKIENVYSQTKNNPNLRQTYENDIVYIDEETPQDLDQIPELGDILKSALNSFINWFNS